MSCDQIQEDLVAYVLDDLSLGQAERVRQHLNSGCTSCNSELVEVRKQLEHVFEAIPEEKLSEAEIEQIHRRVVAKHHARSTSPSVFVPNVPSVLAYPAAFAVGLALAIVLLTILPRQDAGPNIAGHNAQPNQNNTVVDASPPGNELRLPDSFREYDNVVFTAYEAEPAESTRAVRSMLLYDAFCQELHYFANSNNQTAQQCEIVLSDLEGKEIARQAFVLGDSGKTAIVIPNIDSHEFYFRIEFDN